MKICSKCKEAKDESEFYKNRGKKDGLHDECKKCIKEYNAKPEVKERKKEIDAEYRSRPEIKEKNKEKARERNARPEVKERQKEYNVEYNARLENKERKKEYNAEYSSKPENKEKRNQRAKERCQTDSCYKLRSCISRSVRHGIKNNGGSKRGSSILNKLPYTMQELKQHIESLWESWMNWNNYGKYDSNRRTWQIDHIKPHFSFYYESMDCEEFRQCWALSNLRPLESLANIKKGNKISGV